MEKYYKNNKKLKTKSIHSFSVASLGLITVVAG